MKLRCLLPLFFAPLLQAENEIGFVEKFALAKDREAVLQQLVPGTEQYYFFHALHFQNSQQPAKLAGILEQWAKRYPHSDQRRVIENREALLAYDANPQQTLAFLRDRLGLSFHHGQEVRDQKPDLPAVLAPQRIARKAFLEEALRHDDLQQLQDAALEELVRDKTPLRPAQRRALLARLTRPDVPGLVELIAEELKTAENRPFGEFPIHTALLPDQLEALAKLVPRIADDSALVYAQIRKLAPSADTDAEFDPPVREAWLDRVWAYVKTLPAPFNSLKVHVLYARLDHDRKRGLYDEARFREYLLLPRQAPYLNPKWVGKLRGETTLADFNADFAETRLALPPIRSDEALVREYFLQILAKADAWEPWATQIRDTWLKPVFAEAKIINGIGDPEKWASLLSPAAFQALKDRVDIQFPATNPPFLAPTEEVTFAVALKNTPKLIVKIYEVNTLAFFLSQQRPLNTDLNLDGLVANSEQTYDGEASPFRRVTRTFKFPELSGKRGAWVIEFIGGGKSSRALIRKGQFKVLQQAGPAGDLLTVLDETNAPVLGAAIWADGRKYSAAPVGEGQKPDPRILIPFTAQPGSKPIVLADAEGGFASLTRFQHHGEEYKLDAQFHVEREQLLARRQATLAVRSALLLGQAHVALELLQNAKLAITSLTLDGISTTTEVKAPKLLATEVFTHTINVPERLARLTVTLSGQVEVLSKGGEKQDLVATESWAVNGIDKTEATNDGHVSKLGEDFVFELLGKNGEPLPDQQVVFFFHHEVFHRPIELALRTDEKGRVSLGKLSDIARVETQLPNTRKGRWVLKDFERTWPEVLHVKAGEKLEMPWRGELKPGAYSLLELRGGEFAADRTDWIALPAAAASPSSGSEAKPSRSSSLSIGPLAAGDYSLQVRGDDGQTRNILVRVSAAQAVQNWLLGPNRSLEVRDAQPLHLDRLQVTDAGLTVKLTNWNAFTRVHVAANRFLPDRGLFHGLAGFNRFTPTWGTPDKLPNLFSSGRDIGDEYRYIIERRYTTKFPGNLLSRPGLLLNPWEKRKTDNEDLVQQVRQAAASTAGGRAGNAPESLASMEAADTHRGDSDGPNLDFLAQAAPVLWNLVPDKDGLVVIPRKLLGDRQHVQIYAEDLTNAVSATVSLPEQATKFIDLRLSRNLDPAKTFTERKQVSLLTAGQSFKVEDLLTSELESYDTLAGVHTLFTTLSGEPKLAEFAWLMSWPTLKAEEQRAKYSQFACHELNFFLSRKDPDFFAKVIQPALRNKKDKTFLDDYLLGNDLRPYLAPWQFARLNVAERTLLASRIPGEGPNTARHLRELWELLPPNPEHLDQLFETALRGRALDEIPADLAVAGIPGLEAAADSPKPAGPGGGGGFARQKAKAASTQNRLSAAAPAPAPAMAAGRISGLAALSDEDQKQSSDKLSKMEESLDRLGGERFVREYKQRGGRADVSREESDVQLRSRLTAGKDADGLDAFYFGAAAANQQRGLALQQAFYRRLGPAREWAENNYHKRPIAEQNAELITINAFWRDYAAWVAEGSHAPFLSKNVAEASRSFPEMILALAVLDLPFAASEHPSKTEGATFSLTAAGPMIVFHKEIKLAEPAAAGQPAGGLLLSENFFREGDRYRNEGNERFDKFVTGEFLAGVVYGAKVIVTNPNSAPVKLDLLAQIPQGALPVRGSKATDSRYLRLEPYTTQQLEYYFYFPAPAAAHFPHYPVTVALGGKSVATAKAFTFRVVRQLSEIDKASWDYLSQYGSEADVFTFLAQNNVERLNLERVAWRARSSVDFFRRLVTVLETRHLWSEPIYRYALQHNEVGALREWLRRRDDFLAQCGPWLESKPVKIDPIERRAYEHLEYSPLINQRFHRLGAEHRIANKVLLAQYQQLLNILTHKPALDASDEMSVVYYLFLQDRVEEALARFHTIQPESLPTRLQHDYFRCYAAFYEEKLPVARSVAAAYGDYPVDRWRSLFAQVTAQLNEIEGQAGGAKPDGQPDREKQHSSLAEAQPSFDFKVENRTISLSWKNLSELTVNFYLMDPEFLFSSSPFVSADPGRFSIIKPTRIVKLTLPEGKDTLEVPLPAEFAKANVLVEILGAGQRKAHPYHANTLKLTIAEQYGRLEVRDSATDRAVSKAYVKVYARLKNGTIRFLKDGYTDLRGKFDYASVNSPENPPPSEPRPFPASESASGNLDYQTLKPNELLQLDRLSVLILSETHGAAVREAAPPSE